ncbi:hypothetical protein EYC84_011883 [Monilinia fructicola]|uniref:MYND-type domain-containing protein n=1 Tax=Monilinia fructicola TaxID=38448 RepID=A0A5M9J419_MONFR|nr:hypothetical protein EYC84_011883 [Monilinia fructicola]
MAESPSANPSSSTSGAPQKSHHCVICAFPAPSKCAGCKQVWYCSSAHQKQAWPKHKRLCKIYQNPSPPSADTYSIPGCVAVEIIVVILYVDITMVRATRRKDWKKCEKCVGGDLLNLTTAITQGTSSFNFKDDQWKDAPELKPVKCGNCNKIISTATEPYTGWGGSLRCMNCGIRP